MKDDLENEGSKDYDSKSVMIVSKAGQLKRLYTPFQVSRISDLGKRRWYIVQAVRTTKDEKLVYVIDGASYFYFHFAIEIR